MQDVTASTKKPRQRHAGRSETPQGTTIGPASPDLAALHPALPKVLARLAAAPDGRRKLEHSLRVMAAVRGRTARLVAALHDVVETTDLTLDDLERFGFPRTAIRRVDLLTRRPRERYFTYIRRLMPDPVARSVKLADLADNAARLRQLAPRSARAQRKLRRNRAARRLLLRANASRTPPAT